MVFGLISFVSTPPRVIIADSIGAKPAISKGKAFINLPSLRRCSLVIELTF